MAFNARPRMCRNSSCVGENAITALFFSLSRLRERAGVRAGEVPRPSATRRPLCLPRAIVHVSVTLGVVGRCKFALRRALPTNSRVLGWGAGGEERSCG